MLAELLKHVLVDFGSTLYSYPDSINPERLACPCTQLVRCNVMPRVRGGTFVGNAEGWKINHLAEKYVGIPSVL
jgi:hypothetical protein